MKERNVLLTNALSLRPLFVLSKVFVVVASSLFVVYDNEPADKLLVTDTHFLLAGAQDNASSFEIDFK